MESAPDVVTALTRAISNAACYIEAAKDQDQIASILARPDRVGDDVHISQSSLIGLFRIGADGEMRGNANYLLIGKAGALRPDAS